MKRETEKQRLERIIDGVTQGAEETIFILTGRHVVLQRSDKLLNPKHEVYEMLAVIAKALDMAPESYGVGKKRIYIDLRCIATMMMKIYFKQLRLCQMAEALGLKGDNIICKYSRRAQDYIDTKDPVFMPKYNKAFDAVKLWIKD